MSCIVAVRSKDGIWMGADTLTTYDDYKQITDDKKIFIRDGYMIGVAGKSEFMQKIKHFFELPEIKCGIDIQKFMIGTFARDLKLFAEKEDIISPEQEGKHVLGEGVLLICVANRIFEIDVFFTVTEQILDYAAIGTGGDHAEGSLHATKNKSPHERVESALKAACSHVWSCGDEFVFLNLPANQQTNIA